MTQDQADAFRALHAAESGFIMPNAWDAGSARMLAAAGFPAIGTTSAGIAFSLGRQDYGAEPAHRVSRDAMLARIREIAAASPVPVNADLEAGYGDAPEEVAVTIRDAMAAGAAGGNIEDKIPDRSGLYDLSLAVERIQAAREAIDAAGGGFVLTARTDAIVAAGGLGEAIARANRYREAGADCLFAPGAADPDAIGALVREIDGPVNCVLGLGSNEGNAHAWIERGVQRVSLGGTIARACLGLIRDAATELRAKGSIGFAERQIPQAELNRLFAGRA